MMTAAFGVCMAEGVVMFRATRTNRAGAKLRHWVLMILAWICGLFGFIAVVVFHNDMHFPNFYSVHAWVGLVALVGMTLQLAGGLYFYLLRVPGERARAAFVPFHAFAGTTVFACGMASIVLGLLRKQDAINGSAKNLYGDVQMIAGIAALSATMVAISVFATHKFNEKCPVPGASVNDSSVAPLLHRQ
jgi:hypothetical protein